MLANEKLSLKGALIIELNGKIVRKIDNLVVTVGKNWVASRMAGVVDAVMTHMAIGTGTTAAAIGNTTLETESAASRIALTVSGGTPSTNTVTYACTFAADTPDVTAPATAPITEAGLFNNITAGIMAARTVFPVINKGEADTMTISWVITIS
jgi:glycine cleavage system regulatory protein